ncbi:CoA transferase [Sphingomonas sp.]|uniref:CoA transferase n=1 Tax=Sphingomonas sp. TaxID=28214 RepID=UPI003B00D186
MASLSGRADREGRSAAAPPLSAEVFGRRFLADLGIAAPLQGSADHPALAWRRAGLMSMTGRRDGPALVCPAPLAAAADGAMLAMKAIVPAAAGLPRNGSVLLGERARLMRLERAGRTSTNGTCHLLDARDGRVALNLARPEDWELIPAWLEHDVDDLSGIAAQVRCRSVVALVERATLLGLAVAADARSSGADWCRIDRRGKPRAALGTRPFVVDLSGLWAGPLAGALLMAAGADVVKVESHARPDGARFGNAPFFDLLNGGKSCVTIDLAAPSGRAALARLIARADIVIEGTRPRALQQLGIDAEAFVGTGATWIAVTGHGRDGADAMRVGFGDDAAVAGGLSAAMNDGWGEPLFAGDAIADPLTGLLAALAAWASWCDGGGRLIALSLRGTIAHVAQAAVKQATLQAWQRLAEDDDAPFYPLRVAPMAARALGADNDAILSC